MEANYSSPGFAQLLVLSSNAELPCHALRVGASTSTCLYLRASVVLDSGKRMDLLHNLSLCLEVSTFSSLLMNDTCRATPRIFNSIHSSFMTSLVRLSCNELNRSIVITGYLGKTASSIILGQLCQCCQSNQDEGGVCVCV